LLRKNFFSPEQVAAIAKDFRNAGLPPEEVAVMEFVQKVVTHPHLVNEQDYDGLQTHGFSENEILDIVLACCARRFISTFEDAIGCEPSGENSELGLDVIKLLAVGRPLPEEAAS
jgi:alkylhydroperoxidase family enzyme